jgi:hypothetical protein
LNDSPTSVSAIGQAGKQQFPDPWCDYASSELPRTLMSLIRWGVKLWYSNGLYRAAMERAVRYFITSPVFDCESDSEVEKYRELFLRELDLPAQLALLGADFVALGNSFSSLYIPYERYLRCPACGMDKPIGQVEYEWNDFEFKGRCAHCNKRVTYLRADRRVVSRDRRLKVVRWNPLHMVLQYNVFNDETEYRYRIPDVVADAIRRGDAAYLAGAPWEFVECVKRKKLFKFNKNKIFHMREDALAGIHGHGWGMPRFVSNFRQAYYTQVLHRFNEAIALDYIVPTRVVFPRASGGADVAQTINYGMFRNQVLDMLAQRRKDPAAWNFLPFPIEYATLGGEAAQLAAHELLNQASQELMDGFGIPLEMQRGNLQAQAAPMALRMFQQLWCNVPAQYNAWLQWAADQVAELRNWKLVKASLQPVTQADDLEKKQILLQLASANKISMSSALSPFGVDVRKEMEQMYAEQRMQGDLEKDFQRRQMEEAEIEQKMQELEAARQAPPPGMGGMPLGGGMPPAAGGPTPGGAGGGGMGGAAQLAPQSPQEMLAKAEEMAMQLLQLPDAQRRSELVNLKHQDEALHALVKSKMETLRQGASLQGRDMVLQQGGGGGGAM